MHPTNQSANFTLKLLLNTWQVWCENIILVSRPCYPLMVRDKFFLHVTASWIIGNHCHRSDILSFSPLSLPLFIFNTLSKRARHNTSEIKMGFWYMKKYCLMKMLYYYVIHGCKRHYNKAFRQQWCCIMHCHKNSTSRVKILLYITLERESNNTRFIFLKIISIAGCWY